MQILILENEMDLRNELLINLKNKGYVIHIAINGEEGLFYIDHNKIDLAIIDFDIPGLVGIQLVKRIRDFGKNFPILILTGHNHWQEKVAGFDVGVDDYMVKPFHMEELYARISALIRRSSGFSQDLIKVGPVFFNLKTQVVKVNENVIDLTAYEYKILKYLLLHHNEIISKTELTEHIYQQDFDRDSNVIEVFVSRLRKKLDPSNQYNLIETIRGRGYRFFSNTS